MAEKKKNAGGDQPASLTQEEAAEFERLLAGVDEGKADEASKDAEVKAEPPIPLPLPLPLPSTPHDPIAELRGLVEDLRKQVSDLREEIRDVGGAIPELSDQIGELRQQLKDLADFRDKAVEVVTQTAEAAAHSAVDGALQRTWLPRFQEVLALVREHKERAATSDAETAELRLHLPLLRRHMDLEDRIRRGEAAADRADKALALIQQAVGRLRSGSQQDQPSPAAIGERDPLA